MKTEQMSRRAVLLAGGAALAAAGSPAPSDKPRKVRFGVRSPLPAVSLRERAMLVGRLGFDGIELGQEWLDQPVESIQKQLAGTGVVVSAIVGSIQLLDTDPQKRAGAVELDRRRLRMAKQLGADCVIEVPVFGPTRFQDLSPIMTPREIEEKLLVGGLKQLIGDVESTGITLLLEPCNHQETHFMNRQAQAAATIEAVGAPGFRILSDFYHMQLEEKDIGETMAGYGKYTGYVHLADGEKRTEPGSVPFDYRPGFRALKKWGYAGWLTVESGATDTPEGALGRALTYLKRQWNEA